MTAPASTRASARPAPDGAPIDARSPTRHFAVGLARAVGGALVFGLPLFMTMEMWELGFAMDRLRLALLLVVAVPFLVGLSHVSGFEETFDLTHDVVDAFVAVAVGFGVGAAVLALLGLLEPGMPAGEAIGKVALQAVPGSIGALLAQSQFGQRHDAGASDGEGASDGNGAAGRRPSTYASQVFLMAVGALFLAFNVAPTEEMSLISHLTTPWHGLAIAVVSLAVIHAFVYALEFSGQETVPPGTPFHHTFLRFTVVGYAVALLISAYVLWTFGRLDGLAWAERVTIVLVLGFPASLGAAAARLLL